MNAAILLVSSAWMAGQTPEVIIPVNHAHSASASCGSGCGSACCDSGPRLRDRIRGLFQRGDCCDPCPQTCSQPRCHSFQWPQLNLGHRCQSSCDTCGHRQHHASCDSCGHGDLFGRIRGMFNRDCGCSSGCNTGCCGSSSTTTPAAEPLKDQPKKMPSKSAEPKKGQEARVITPPAQAPLPAIQNAPTIAPVIAPRITDNDTRNPF